MSSEPVAKVSLGLAKSTAACILPPVLNWKGFSLFGVACEGWKHSVILAVSSLIADWSMTWPCQRMLKVQSHKGYGMVDLILLEKALHQLNEAWRWVSDKKFELLTWGHSPIDKVSFPLPFLSPQKQQQCPGVADGLENKTRICWDTVCMQWGKGKATLAVSEDISASKHGVRQKSSLPETTQTGEVLERVVWMVAWMFPLLEETLAARCNSSVTLSRVQQQISDF